MSQTIIATAKDPRNGSDIVIYKQTWTVHILKNHSELEDCGNGNDCLTEVVTTLNNPDIIRAGRNPEKEELFIRYTTSEDFGVYQGISVSTRTENNKITMEQPSLNDHNKQEYPPMHTTEHVINRTMVNLFGCGRAISAHIERKKSKLDFALQTCPEETDIIRIENTVNEVLRRNLQSIS